MFDEVSYIMGQKAGGGSGGGSGGGFLKVGIDMETWTLDKTWKQIYDALSAGYYVNIATHETEGEPLQASQGPVYKCLYDGESDRYEVRAYNVRQGGIQGIVSVTTFITSSENGYPVINNS